MSFFSQINGIITFCIKQYIFRIISMGFITFWLELEIIRYEKNLKVEIKRFELKLIFKCYFCTFYNSRIQK